MKPIRFKQMNQISTPPPDGNGHPVPLYAAEGQIITCWGLSLFERLAALLTGRIYLSVICEQMPPTLLIVWSPFKRTK